MLLLFHSALKGPRNGAGLLYNCVYDEGTFIWTITRKKHHVRREHRTWTEKAVRGPEGDFCNEKRTSAFDMHILRWREQ